ncbi:alpha/beta fold hydrolase [Achromobacter xylosoxidans]|uniref:alpha/beta fold hydrolase n=1 Tax=Alcaligenes xylosoxydans xylosoxydans TaxID=85698 RepID=UPI003763C314
MSSIASQDVHVSTPQGRLFARRWDPAGRDADAAPIVLLHDSLGCVELWRDFPEQLAAATGRAVIAYDRLGFGRSDPNPATLTTGFVEAEARDGFQAVRQALGIGRFIAFGHSVGGGMGIYCAATHPQDCDALITESAQTFAENRTLDGIRAAQRNFAEPGQLDRLKKYHGDKAAWVLSAWVDTWLSPAFADWKLDDALRQVKCPVLALHGEVDEYGSAAHPEIIARLTGGKQALLENCGHVPHREQARIVLDLAGQWLRGAVPG